jgi:hypothetical protein
MLDFLTGWMLTHPGDDDVINVFADQGFDQFFDVFSNLTRVNIFHVWNGKNKDQLEYTGHPF